MSEEAFEREVALNREAWERLRDQLRRDHKDGYIVIAHGRLIDTPATFEEAEAAIKQLRPAPRFFLLFPADDEPHFEPVWNY